MDSSVSAKPAPALARLKEAVELIRELWTRDFVTFDGQFYRTDNATIYDRPETAFVASFVGENNPFVGRVARATQSEVVVDTELKAGALTISEAVLPGLETDEDDLAVAVDSDEEALDVFRRNPNHPGAVHYVIHSFDDPIHAPLALEAAHAVLEHDGRRRQPGGERGHQLLRAPGSFGGYQSILIDHKPGVLLGGTTGLVLGTDVVLARKQTLAEFGPEVQAREIDSLERAQNRVSA